MPNAPETDLRLLTRGTPLVTRDDAKAHLRVMGSQDDDYIDSLLAVASDHVADATNLQPEDAVYRLSVSHGGIVRPLHCVLPRRPLRSIVSIQADGVSVLAEDIEVVDANSRFPTVCVSKQVAKEWTVSFVAGHGGLDTAADLIQVSDPTPLPAQAGHVIKLLTAHWFEIREPLLLGSIRTKLDFTVDALLSTLKRTAL